nr:MAG TPA: hypothetical protein [Caudoviricetes sp.]
MAKKISQLTQATQVKSDDVTVIVQDGETKKLPLNMMVTKQDIENKKVAGLAKLDEIEATYENDTYTPTIAVKNKSSVKVGEGDGVDYSANVMDGHVKSAILKGQTLVNLVKDLKDERTNNNSSNSYVARIESVKTNTTYMVIAKIKSSNPLSSVSSSSFFRVERNSDGVSLGGFTGDITTEYTTKSFTFNTDNESIVRLNLRNAYNDWGLTENTAYVKEVMLIEYQEGMENWDIPYFEGIQSVKMPVLTTTGKNLLNPLWKKEYGRNQSFKLKKGTTLTLSTKDSIPSLGGNLLFNDVSGGERWFSIDKGATKKTITLYEDVYQVKYLLTGDIEYQLEIGSVATSYEPYKTNILTVNEDVTLRSNGDICDELNLLTGQLTQRIGEDGVVLSQEVVKTVDLMPSGTHPSTTPYCWKNGHIQLSSSGLLPNLEYSVVTSRAGQINQNATMIVKNDKRIFDLEILLAGGLVNTTYQALTLQNQVETGLSKVSLNSETEPDYLLYHMIMKLIEEKAYKLDDLTEKVSVFYLYEKLSDEQFETIYSALYPFVEDEIVEEPVVEELPEVVEDEVIM